MFIGVPSEDFKAVSRAAQEWGGESSNIPHDFHPEDKKWSSSVGPVYNQAVFQLRTITQLETNKLKFYGF